MRIEQNYTLRNDGEVTLVEKTCDDPHIYATRNVELHVKCLHDVDAVYINGKIFVPKQDT